MDPRARTSGVIPEMQPNKTTLKSEPAGAPDRPLLLWQKNFRRGAVKRQGKAKARWPVQATPL